MEEVKCPKCHNTKWSEPAIVNEKIVIRDKPYECDLYYELLYTTKRMCINCGHIIEINRKADINLTELARGTEFKINMETGEF